MNTENFKTENNICDLVGSNIADFGKFFGAIEGTQNLAEYFRLTNTSPNDPNLIFGQLLGLNTFKKLIAKIDAYNNGTPAADQISALRVYNAMSMRPFLPAPDNTKLLADIIIMPVLANGKDLYTIYQLTDPNLMLGEAMPCPNQCATGFYLV